MKVCCHYYHSTILNIMALVVFRIMAPVFFLYSFLNFALCCDWLSHHSHLRNTSMVLIEDMGDSFTNQTSPVPFPYNLYRMTASREANSQLLFIRDSLKHICDLYRYNALPATWDAVKAEAFLESINRQIVELDQCVESGHKERPNRKLKHYYKKLRNRTLSHDGGSREGWEVIRNETKTHLLRLDLLGNLLLAASRGRPATHL